MTINTTASSVKPQGRYITNVSSGCHVTASPPHPTPSATSPSSPALPLCSLPLILSPPTPPLPPSSPALPLAPSPSSPALPLLPPLEDHMTGGVGGHGRLFYLGPSPTHTLHHKRHHRRRGGALPFYVKGERILPVVEMWRRVGC